MKLTTGIEKAVAGLYNLFTINEWQEARTVELAATIGVRESDINIARRILSEQGSLEYRMERDPRKGKATSSYRLIEPAEVAARKISEDPTPSVSHWRADHGEEALYTRGVLKRWKNEETTVYVAEEPEPAPAEIEIKPVEPKPVTLTRNLGDLAPLRKSEPRALVEATRQYAAKWGIAKEHAKALVDAGLTNDTATILDNLKLRHDPQFDAVVLVLPYIDELERRIANLEKLVDPLRAKAARVDELEVQLRRVRDQNTRLISAKAEASLNTASRD